jgi:hypothetical protein
MRRPEADGITFRAAALGPHRSYPVAGEQIKAYSHNRRYVPGRSYPVYGPGREVIAMAKCVEHLYGTGQVDINVYKETAPDKNEVRDLGLGVFSFEILE